MTVVCLEGGCIGTVFTLGSDNWPGSYVTLGSGSETWRNIINYVTEIVVSRGRTEPPSITRCTSRYFFSAHCMPALSVVWEKGVYLDLEGFLSDWIISLLQPQNGPGIVGTF